MKKNQISFGPVLPFDFQIHHVMTDSGSPNNTFDSHVHKECEIYVNVSGDVSFAVEGRLYPVLPGSIVITRPYEYHHCIYHSGRMHEHYWILFSCDGNEGFLDSFFRRRVGENNLLILSPEKSASLLNLCRTLVDADPADGENYFRFFRLLSLLRDAEVLRPDASYPRDLILALDYVGKHFSEPVTVRDLAAAAHVSVNTLERHFSNYLGRSPLSYLRIKRLAHSAKLLSEGWSVMDACIESGFSDCSAFIVLFKKTYGVTPLQYKKQKQI